MAKMNASDFVAVVDTNVLLDIYSCHDLAALYDRHEDTEIDEPSAVYRRARVRESLLLATYFSATGATTASSSEPLPLLLERVDPCRTLEFETHFTTAVVHFVKDYLLPGWSHHAVTSDRQVRGAAADQWLLDFAQQSDLPLITNEGFTVAGIQPRNLRADALRASVPVYTPGEFWADKLDAVEASRMFLGTFGHAAEKYLVSGEKPDGMRDLLLWVHGYYRHVLLGETPMRSTPLQVTVGV